MECNIYPIVFTINIIISDVKIMNCKMIESMGHRKVSFISIVHLVVLCTAIIDNQNKCIVFFDSPVKKTRNISSGLNIS